MKVLVISLLRLGDFLQTLPVLNAIRTQLPVRKLDVLVHEPVKQLAPMIANVNHWWTIDRDGLQEGLGRVEIPLLTSFSVLKERLDEINDCKYDYIINLSQTHYSAWIAGYLKTQNRAGLMFDSKGLAHFHSPWFRYLDEHSPLAVKDVFHYSDIFFYGSGLKGPERNWTLRETAAGREEVAKLALSSHEKIVLQVFTSDTKKNWSESSWLKMMGQLQLFRPNAQFVLLCAPSEETRLQSFLHKAALQGIRASKAVLSLEGAYTLLKQSRLLISGDTSIKHLANAAEISILELSLGSSDYRRNGAYTPNSIILQSLAACAPCPHSAPCSQSEHLCGARLSPEVVSAVAHHQLAGDSRGMENLAREFVEDVRVLRTKILASGFWFAQNLAELETTALVEQLIERCTWKFLLNREFMDPLAQYGSEGVRLHQELSEILPVSEWSKAVEHLSFLESEADALREKAQHLLGNARNRVPVPSGEIPEIGTLRRAHNQLENQLQQSRLKVKLIRSLKSQLMES